MIYDTFSFFNELDLLEIRLNVLKDVVDRFVLVESAQTHTGLPKPLHFKENKARFAPFLDRIEYIAIDRFPEICRTHWARENWQRNAVTEGLRNLRDDDIVMISDLDEIPRPEKIAEAAAKRGVRIFDQDYYAYFLNYRNVRQQWWYGTRMVSGRDFRTCFDGIETPEDEFLPAGINRGTTASKIRCRRLPSSRGGSTVIRGGGWHFTSLGGAGKLAEKMKSFAHQEYNRDLTAEELERMITEGRGPFWDMQCFAEPVDATYPRYLRENQQRYQSLIRPTTPEYLAATRFPRLKATLKGRLIGWAEETTPSAVKDFLHRVKLRLRRG